MPSMHSFKIVTIAWLLCAASAACVAAGSCNVEAQAHTSMVGLKFAWFCKQTSIGCRAHEPLMQAVGRVYFMLRDIGLSGERCSPTSLCWLLEVTCNEKV